MMTGRLIILLVVMASLVASGRPAVGGPESAVTQELAGRSWTERLSVGRSLSRIGFLQRVTLRVPSPRLASDADHSTRSPRPVVADAFRFCLPPPLA